MNTPSGTFESAASHLSALLPGKPDFAVVLGTGLGGLLHRIDPILTVPYAEIPNFPRPTVESHDGKLVYGTIGSRKVLCFSGRFHYYEGYSMEQIVLPVRVSKLLNCDFLILSNAAGGLNPAYRKGDLMLAEDHLNLLPTNPLIGPNHDSLGPRFTDLSAPYDPKLNLHLTRLAAESETTLHQGVYVAVQGPMLETRAEYRYLRAIGADAVGMSTVPEVIAANHCGLPCAAISVITDECDPDHLEPINVPEIIRVAGEAEPRLVNLIEKLAAIV
ncbi:MAG: purine-nucleoside phosphorylase [Puniceicoccaceae bacterium]